MAARGDVGARGRPLRVALLLGAPVASAWVARAIELLRGSDKVEIALAVVDPEAPPDDGRPRATGALALYRRLDDRVFGSEDALALRDVRLLLTGVPTLVGSAQVDARGDLWPRELAPRVRAHGVDVAIAFSLRTQPADVADAAVHGVVACYVGSDSSAGASEVFGRARGTETGLRRWLPGKAAPDTWIRAVAPTDPVSPRRGLGTLLAHTAELPLRALRDLARGRVEARLAPPVAYQRRVPGAAGVALGAGRVLARIALRRALRARFVDTWQVGARFGGDPRNASDVRYFESPPDRFLADPFAIERDGRTFVFFEEFLYARGLGRISCAELLPDARLAAPEVVLEQPWHLSYPFLFEHGGALYLLPESGAAGRLDLYRCVEFPRRFEHVRTLLEGVAAFDPTLHKGGDRWWLFAVIAPPGGNSYTDLHLFSADDPLGPWTPHPENPVKSDARSSRGAGAIFREGGAWIRPAQDCSREYGAAVSFQRILRLDSEAYEEEEIGALLPTAPRQVGIHTVNRVGAALVFDRLVSLRRGVVASPKR